MRLYSGTSEQFIEDNVQNSIADKLKASFFQHFRHNPSESEVRSWRESLRATSLLFHSANLYDQGVLIEYQLPQTSRRLDCMICGKDGAGKDNATIIELKQWDACADAEGENEVLTYVGGGNREVLHPSAQVNQYRIYLQDTHTAFYDGQDPVNLSSCAYLHNYPFSSEDALFNKKFATLLRESPLFTKDDVAKLKAYLTPRLVGGSGMDVLNRIDKSTYRPSKKLMQHVASVIEGNKEYVLLDDQLIVYDKLMAWAKQGFHGRKKSVIIVKGGPGTGKSVIAMNLMAGLSRQNILTYYATGSKAFTETLRRIVGTRGGVQFKYFNGFAEARPNEVDVLIADEAHRIRKTSNNRFTPAVKRSGLPQVDELIRASKVSVFFIDDLQVVRPDEIGSVDYIRQHAQQLGAEIVEYELQAQFRCNGSDAFINWVNNTLDVRRTANVLWDEADEFDFKIFGSPEELENAIREKAKQGYTARMTAGFCWPWSDQNPDGTLRDDVVIGNYRRPWNAKHEASRLPKGVPKAQVWAYEEGGIDQIGCIYTAQGFEFDYVGVIFGKDLTYDLDEGTWKGHKDLSEDNAVKRSKDRFTDLVKNTYRVLLTRGMRGCYVYFMDKDTERFFRSRMDRKE